MRLPRPGRGRRTARAAGGRLPGAVRRPPPRPPGRGRAAGGPDRGSRGGPGRRWRPPSPRPRPPRTASAATTRRTLSIAHHYPGDPGVIAAMLLNHVQLQPGEALFLGAGVPHAYLNGLGVEIMANSDNVLRCGLTPKHVDVPELLRIVRFEATEPGILRPEASPSARSCTTPPSTNSGCPATRSPRVPRRATSRPPPPDPALLRTAPPGERPRPRSRRLGLRPGGREGRTVRYRDRFPRDSGGLINRLARPAATMSRRTAAPGPQHQGRDFTHP